MRCLCARTGRCADGPPGAILSLARLSESGSLGVVEMGAQSCVFHELCSCGDSFSGAGEVGITSVHGTDGQEETREKLCSDELGPGQVGEQATCVSISGEGPGFPCHLLLGLRPWTRAARGTGSAEQQLRPHPLDARSTPSVTAIDIAQSPLGAEPPQLGTPGLIYF